ncbi:unnamed protein product [Heligmosomoides polygyrus]|uniref:28S ribosomal protein S24, mitochondrial n=1 Tax=Heligmosomoides polygyrus TaxID=6339 RepID=A0A183FN86_HELPZ|nr:unnamed protein product [Heligmosomoides polygyrus]
MFVFRSLKATIRNIPRGSVKAVIEKTSRNITRGSLTNGIEETRRNIPWSSESPKHNIFPSKINDAHFIRFRKPGFNLFHTGQRLAARVRLVYQAIGRNAGKLNPIPVLVSSILFQHMLEYTLHFTSDVSPQRFLQISDNDDRFGKLRDTDQVCIVLRTMYYQVSTFAYLVVIMDVQLYNGKYQFYEVYPIGDVLHMVKWSTCNLLAKYRNDMPRC